MESYSVTKKEVNPTIRDNMDKSGVYYTKWNNPKSNVCDINCMWNLKQNKSDFIETDMLVARGWGEIKMGI